MCSTYDRIGNREDIINPVHAPRVGPVSCFERMLVWAGDPEWRAFEDLTLTLTATSPATPAAAALGR